MHNSNENDNNEISGKYPGEHSRVHPEFQWYTRVNRSRSSNEVQSLNEVHPLARDAFASRQPYYIHPPPDYNNVKVNDHDNAKANIKAKVNVNAKVNDAYTETTHRGPSDRVQQIVTNNGFQSQKNKRTYPWLRLNNSSKKKKSIMEFFGIFPSIPTVNIMKFCSLVILIILVEMTIMVSIESSGFLFLEEFQTLQTNELVDFQMIGFFGVIGISLGILYRYIEYEYFKLKSTQLRQQHVEFKYHLKLIFLILIYLFIIFEIIFELVFSRGILILLDLISILILTYGSYIVFSGKRHLIVFPMLFIFFFIILGFGQVEPDLPMLLLLGLLTLIYLEFTDGACKLQEYISKYHYMTKDLHPTAQAQINTHMNQLSIRFVKTLGIFIAMTMVIVGLLLLVFTNYRIMLPPFMHENLELQTVYGIFPVIVILVFVFTLIYFVSLYQTSKLKSLLK